MDYDPRAITYTDLLAEIWRNRRGGRAYSRQYMDAVFCANGEQEAIARTVGIRAPIITGARFYLAEDYHQKYYLRHDPVLMRELADYTPEQLVESTVAARLNAFVAGTANRSLLADELPRLGLSAAASAHLERLVDRRERINCA